MNGSEGRVQVNAEDVSKANQFVDTGRKLLRYSTFDAVQYLIVKRWWDDGTVEIQYLWDEK